MTQPALLGAFIHDFARAGGGGSSSDGNGVGLFVALGYLVTYYPMKPIKKHVSKDLAMIVSIIIASVLTVVSIVVAAVSASGLVWWLAIEFIGGIWLGWYGAMFSIWDKMKKKFQKADEDLAKAGWDEPSLHQLASQTFLRYQNDWSRRDSSRFAEYMTPYYAYHAGLMVRTLAEMRRFNVMSNAQITRLDTSAVYDNTNDSQDFFSVLIEATANDQLYDEISQTYLFTDAHSFVEEWTFQRSGTSWALANIRQATAEVGVIEQSVQQFATTNNMVYCLDMGWLFLPSRGELFKGGGFGKSDINNHAVGVVNNVLVQLYTYSSCPGNANANKIFLVGQINVPQVYGGILIERRKGLLNRFNAPHGYQKYEFEWPDFNNRYSVYATDQSRLAAFELINPGFMAYLYDNFNDVSIEVVDTSIYFYSEKEAFTTSNDYSKHLELLMKAFKELRL